jgi:hypothetical protein
MAFMALSIAGRGPPAKELAVPTVRAEVRSGRACDGIVRRDRQVLADAMMAPRDDGAIRPSENERVTGGRCGA